MSSMLSPPAYGDTSTSSKTPVDADTEAKMLLSHVKMLTATLQEERVAENGESSLKPTEQARLIEAMTHLIDELRSTVSLPPPTLDVCIRDAVDGLQDEHKKVRLQVVKVSENLLMI